jgi:hypothetical protein
MSRLVGDIRTSSVTPEKATILAFMEKLELLMLEYGVDKIDVGWGAPEACPRCGNKQGAKPRIDPKDVVEELTTDDPRLKPTMEKAEALDMLGDVVDKMPSTEISLEIPTKTK